MNGDKGFDLQVTCFYWAAGTFGAFMVLLVDRVLF